MPRSEIDELPAWCRPIRVPRDVAVTHAKPAYAVAGRTSSWQLPFALSKAVKGDAALKLQIAGGRNNKGLFCCKAPSARLADGRVLATAPDETPGTYVLTVPPDGLRHSDTVSVTLAECTAPRVRQLNKLFVLYLNHVGDDVSVMPQWSGGSVWAEGSSDQIVAVCTLHVLGGEIDHLRAYVPSQSRSGEMLRILIRPEDAFDNLSHERPKQISVFHNNQPLPSILETVENSTCVQAWVTLPVAGVHRLRVVEQHTGKEAVTNPTVCSSNGDAGAVYWGMIHGHTEMSDGTGTLDQYFHQLRDEVALDFAATSDHDHLWETSDTLWTFTCEAVKHWNQPGDFVTFLGYEWAKWRRNGDGDRNVYYLTDDRPMYRSDEGEYPSPPDLFGALHAYAETAIVIPHHTGHGGNYCDWKDHDAAYERLVEIYQVRGSYECPEADGNPVPERSAGVPPYPGGYVRNALSLGWRAGFTAGGDDHRGQWGTQARIGEDYAQGLMSVEATDLSRESIFSAMVRRRTVATTGARLLLTYRLNGSPMGSELSLTELPDLAAVRAFSIQFHGTAELDRIDIIRNGAAVHAIEAGGVLDFEATWLDTEPLDGIWLPPARYRPHPFAYYYVRAVQQDGEVAWASPIWIDP